ncbi:hypothetical protein HNP38_000507 [Chryseobacterium defluvii]|uniref:Uncharacterized protein n=1 Tax=Chryseobacterium defluvii TaxID=160396 RepID=A0A840K9Z3_9FLAO|nr:hypothetical protein [Chryseobacterium defluvii]MBB4805235.1 hypothetical protein [Chryseobacterium defluvii]
MKIKIINKFLSFLVIVLSLSFCTRLTSQSIDFDSVEFYKVKAHKPKYNSANTFKLKTIFGQTSQGDLNDDFPKRIRKIGYKRRVLDSETSDQILKIIERTQPGKYYTTVCRQIYRDILIYRKNGKVVKILKICTSCFANQLITVNDDTELLLIISEYENLRKLLEN